jgi:rod shape-determining protein MreC
MRNLIAFFLKYRNVFLFLFLQVIALSLVFNSLAFQRSAFLNSSSRWTGEVLQSYHFFKEYLNLAQTNERLAKENARLRAALKASYFDVYRIEADKIDTLRQQQFTYLEAQVVNSSVNKRNNHMTLNKGTIHGVERGMAVTSTDGAVGIIKDVSSHFSTVIPLIHSQTLLGGAFKKNKFFGTVSWPGGHYRNAELNEIPKHAQVVVGDTIVTDGRSSVFPKGERIGIVTNDELNPTTGFRKVNIELSVDFNRLEHVYIVKNLMHFEQVQLENQSNNGN